MSLNKKRGRVSGVLVLKVRDLVGGGAGGHEGEMRVYFQSEEASEGTSIL